MNDQKLQEFLQTTDTERFRNLLWDAVGSDLAMGLVMLGIVLALVFGIMLTIHGFLVVGEVQRLTSRVTVERHFEKEIIHGKANRDHSQDRESQVQFQQQDGRGSDGDVSERQREAPVS